MVKGDTLEKYNQKFWDAFLPVASFRMVTLQEQLEKYCCGLPKQLKRYCIKIRACNIQEMMEHAQNGYDLISGTLDYDSDDETN